MRTPGDRRGPEARIGPDDRHEHLPDARGAFTGGNECADERSADPELAST